MRETETTPRMPIRRPRLRLHPAQLILLAFTVGTLSGTALLALPMASPGTGRASLMDSFFTAVSAICVTGLTIVDTHTAWTGFGQVVILVLIQIGGLGVMTFASVVGLAVVRRLSLRSRLGAAMETKNAGVTDVRALVLGVVRISFFIEGVAATILTLWFLLAYGRPPGEALWDGVFHAVSAFNNAGFSLFSDNMVPYVSDPVVCLTLSATIILGGLGFPVLVQLRRHLRQPMLWSMNTRIVIWATIALLVLGAFYITVLEWDNPGTLGQLDPGSRILAGFFQSVQTRTAGFNSVDIGAMNDATLFGMTALMFIGAGSAGTAGGIKVTTFAVLLFILVAEIRGDGVVNVFGKRLSRAVHRQAISVVLLSVAVVTTAVIAIMLLTGFSLGPVLFEAVSAFGTVGLSDGITAELSVPGQLILCALMFLGRLGPITFASALALRSREILYQLPKERPIIG